MSGGYVLDKSGLGVKFEADRLRREKGELIGELTVWCSLQGAKTINGVISSDDFNFSSVRARTDRAKYLQTRASAKELDWVSLLEEFTQGVKSAEREGEPAVDLDSIPRPAPRDEIRIGGLVFPKRHCSIIFGDGGTAKSYLALYIAGKLAQSGRKIGYFDWELAGEDHRERLELLFGPTMPKIKYVRCERPLTSEADRLRKTVRDHALDFAIYDSVAFACDGPPESAESAGKYYRALRQIDCGSLHIAHVNRSEENDKRPFGSTFWHNGARCTYFCKAVDGDSGKPRLQIGLFCRKANLGPLYPAVSFLMRFTDHSTTFEQVEIAENAELAEKLSLRQRLTHLLRLGPMTRDDVIAEIGENPESINRVLRRYRNDFMVIDGGKIALTLRAG